MAFTPGLDISSLVSFEFNTANYVAFGPSYKVFTNGIDISGSIPAFEFNTANYVAFGPSYKVFTSGLDLTPIVGDYGIDYCTPYVADPNRVVKVFQTAGIPLIITSMPHEGEGDVHFSPSIEVLLEALVDFSASPTSGNPPLFVQFTDESTSLPSAWDWDFGDGSPHSYIKDPSHTYTIAGRYTVRMTVTNISGPVTIVKTNYINVALVADFSASTTSGNSPLSVNFTDLSIGSPTSWFWNFGDGSSPSSVQNPSHIYSTAGVYTVTLTASNTGASDTETKTGYITANMVAAFSGTPLSGIAPLIVSFTDLTTGEPTSWDWNFGDGSPHSTTQNPSHTYNDAGDYSITLSASNTGASDSDTQINYVSVDLDVSFSASTLSGTPPLLVNFTDLTIGNPTSWLWNFGDGNTSTSQNPSHTYPNAGTYHVVLTAYRGIKSGSDSVDIAVSMITDFTASTTSGPSPLLVNFTDLTIGNPTSWLWNFGDGFISTIENPSHFYGTPGTYNVILTSSRGATSDTESKPNYILVTPSLNADFIADVTTGSIPLIVTFQDLSGGSPIEWLWNLGDGTYSTEQNPQHVYYNAGFYTISLRIYDGTSYDFRIRQQYIHVLSDNVVIVTTDFAVPENNIGTKIMLAREPTNFLLIKKGIRIFIILHQDDTFPAGFRRPQGPSVLFD